MWSLQRLPGRLAGRSSASSAAPRPLAADKSRIRITLSSRNVRSLEKSCADWIRTTKDLYRMHPQSDELKVRVTTSVRHTALHGGLPDPGDGLYCRFPNHPDPTLAASSRRSRARSACPRRSSA